MCRQNQLWGWILIAFGLGFSIGQCIQGGFLCTCLGVGLMILGCCMMRKR